MRKTQRYLSSQSGFSLLEMLVSVAVMSIVIGSIFAITTQNQMFGRSEAETSETMQTARAAFELMSREIRNAGLGYPTQQTFASASSTRLTIRGTFPKITAVATATDAATGALTVSPIANFAVGQRVLLVDANTTAAAYTTITAVDAGINKLTVATIIGTEVTNMWVIPSTAATTISSFGPGTSVAVVQCITYSISSSGTLARSVAPEVDATATEAGDLANNILAADGTRGLSFTYYDSAGSEVTNPTSAASLASISLIKLALTARNRNRSLHSKEYDAVKLATDIRPRG